jgi:hypothetical protein
MAAASAGTHIPLTGAIVGVVPTLNPATAGTPGSVTVTVTGFFTFRVYYLVTDTITFTGTLVLTPVPSADAGQPGRILSVSGTTALSTTTTGPYHPRPDGHVPLLMAPGWGDSAATDRMPQRAIDGMVAQARPARFVRSPPASSRRRTITGSSLSLALSRDLFGPATPLTCMRPSHPRRTAKGLYQTVCADTGTPVNQASVTLHNFTTTGTVQTVGPLQTDASGTVTFNVALRPKITYQVDPIDHDRTRVFVSPTLTVAKAGFDTISLTLLEDPGDV